MTNMELNYMVCPNISGRVLITRSPNTLYVGNKYTVYRSTDFGKGWQLIGVLPTSLISRCSGYARVLQRLLRYELRCLSVLDTGEMLAASRKGLYWGKLGEVYFQSTEFTCWPRVIYPPMTITSDSEGRFLWGEYGMNSQRGPVCICASSDGGKTHYLVHEFPAGEIRHVHQIIEDFQERCFWVFTGDRDSESGILRLDWDLKRVEWVVRGKQLFRAVVAFSIKDKLIYGTDSELSQNFICGLDKRTGILEKICEIPGSCIYGTRAGKYLVLSTTVEPSKYIKTRMATLWVSYDGIKWNECFGAEKDYWPCKLLQYGAIILPRGRWDSEQIVFSGQALKGLDNRVCIATVGEVS